jgi:hypothetical protein
MPDRSWRGKGLAVTIAVALLVPALAAAQDPTQRSPTVSPAASPDTLAAAIARIAGGGSSPNSTVAAPARTPPATPDALQQAIGQLGALAATAAAGAASPLPGSPAAATAAAVEPTWTPLPSSQSLIADAVAAGQLDEPTSLLYRAYALFGDPRLPAKYAAAGAFGEDPTLFAEIQDQADRLPPGLREQLAAYLLRPTDPHSPLHNPPLVATPQNPFAETSPGPLRAAPAPVALPLPDMAARVTRAPAPLLVATVTPTGGPAGGSTIPPPRLSPRYQPRA